LFYYYRYELSIFSALLHNNILILKGPAMKTFNNFILTIIFILSINFVISGVPVNITVVFPYFQPQAVTIFGSVTGSSWPSVAMQKLSDNTFSYLADISSGSHGFNAYYNIPGYFYSPVYIASCHLNLARIPYVKIYINNQLLSSSYVLSSDGINGNIFFRLTASGQVFPDSSNPGLHKIYIDDRIPPEMPWPRDTIKIPNDVPDPYYRRIAGWVQAVNDNNYSQQSKVEVKYIKLHARMGTQDTIIASTIYKNSAFTPASDGGLYFRYPFWFNDEHEPMPAVIIDSCLTFYPSSLPDTIWHFWTPQVPWPLTDIAYTSYWFEINYRITGKACIQLGIDSRNLAGDKSSNLELAVGNWGFESEDGQFHILTVDTKHYVTSVKDDNNFTFINTYALEQNYPNPFNPNTTINYQLPKSGLVTIKVYDMLGREIQTLVNENKPAGSYNVSFNASKLSTGVYIYRIVAGDYVASKKMTLLK
jgi:hypothetical protein